MEIETPETSNCIPLATKSVTHDSNSDNSTNTSKRNIINVKNTGNFRRKENGFIFEISKRVELPNLFWKTMHIRQQNETTFYQQNKFGTVLKKIHFYNSFVPIIIIYDRKYKFNNTITTIKQLESLLQKVDDI